MKLTNGQKEALARKAEMIIEPKREKKGAELKENFKFGDETRDFLKKAKKVAEAAKALQKAVVETGMYFDYGAIRFNFDGCPLYYSLSSKDDMIEVFADNIKTYRIQKLIDKMYPTYQEIMDELELSQLDKTFDMDSFIKKYENL